MAKFIHTIGPKEKGRDYKEMDIQVLYNPKENKVEEVVSITITQMREGKCVDAMVVLDIFEDHDLTDHLLALVDWPTAYASHLEAEREFKAESFINK